MPIFDPFGFVAQRQIKDLTGRIVQLEKRMGTFDQDVKTIKDDLAATQADVATAKTGITSLQGQVTTLNQTVKDLQDKLANAVLTADQQATLDALVAQADSTKIAADELAAAVNPQPPAGGGQQG